MAMVLFKTGIVVSADIALTVDPVLTVGRLWGWLGGGQIGRVTLLIANGAFLAPAAGPKEIVLITARLGRACGFLRHATAVLCLSRIGRDIRQGIWVAKCVVRLGPGLFGVSLLAVNR